MALQRHILSKSSYATEEYNSLLSQLEELQEKYDDLYNLFYETVKATPSVYFVKDTGNDFRYVYTSNKTNRIWGLEDKDVIGKNDFDLEERPIAERYRKSDEETLKHGITRYITENIPTYDGKNLILDAVKLIVHRKNNPPYLVSMAWDITQQISDNDKFSEYLQRLTWACQKGKIYPWIWNIKENKVELTFVKNGKVDPVTIDLNIFESKILPEDLPIYQNAVKNFVERKTSSFKVSFRTHYFTEDYVWFELTGDIYERDDADKPIKAIGVYRDISADKDFEEEQQARKLAEESDQMKSAFVANMSHEIRTPLNAIVGFSNLMAETDDPEEKQYFLKIIESNNNYLLQLINDILDLSKIESGTIKLNYSDFALNELFEEQENDFKRRVQAGVQVVFEKGDKDYIIHSEKIRFLQVLTNFLSNAVKYTNSGSIRFGYKVKEKELYVYVSDTGTGIESSEAHLVFGRFSQLDNHKSGTGLGLAISKSIVDILDGEIGVDSEEGKGSTFWFRIPTDFQIIE